MEGWKTSVSRKNLYIVWKLECVVLFLSIFHRNCNSWALPENYWAVDCLVRRGWTVLQAAARWGNSSCGYFINADVAQILWRLHHLPRTVASNISKSLTSRLLFVGLFKSKCVQKQPTFTWWTKTKHLRLYLECYNRLHKVTSNTRKRMDACIAKHSGHFQHLL